MRPVGFLFAELVPIKEEKEVTHFFQNHIYDADEKINCCTKFDNLCMNKDAPC